jgi:hypothetical protein
VLGLTKTIPRICNLASHFGGVKSRQCGHEVSGGDGAKFAQAHSRVIRDVYFPDAVSDHDSCDT